MIVFFSKNEFCISILRTLHFLNLELYEWFNVRRNGLISKNKDPNIFLTKKFPNRAASIAAQRAGAAPYFGRFLIRFSIVCKFIKNTLIYFL